MGSLYERIEQLGKAGGYKNMTVLCKAAGVPRTTMSELHAGRSRDLSKPNAQKFADLLELSLDDIYGAAPQKEKPTPRGEPDCLPELNARDRRDIAKRLESTLDLMDNNADGLMFDGEPLDEETRELLRISLQNQLEISKRLAKQKFTPKKYRKD